MIDIKMRTCKDICLAVDELIKIYSDLHSIEESALRYDKLDLLELHKIMGDIESAILQRINYLKEEVKRNERQENN